MATFFTKAFLSEKIQEKLNQSYDTTSRKTSQQLKDVKKKVKDLKHQITKVSSNSSNLLDISSTNLTSQFYEQKDHFDANRKLIDEARLENKDRSTPKTIATALAIGKDKFKESNAISQGRKTNVDLFELLREINIC